MLIMLSFKRKCLNRRGLKWKKRWHLELVKVLSLAINIGKTCMLIKQKEIDLWNSKLIKLRKILQTNSFQSNRYPVKRITVTQTIVYMSLMIKHI